MPDDLGLPRTGILWLFYDAVAQVWGFTPGDAPGFRVLYAADPRDFAPRPPPAARAPPEAYVEVALVPEPWFDLPPSGGIHLDGLHLPAATAEQFSDLHIDLDHRANHKAGGWPDLVQNPMEEECALVTAGIYMGEPGNRRTEEARRILAEPNDWRLLVQIGSDDDAEMMWGDLGRLYLWIREADLSAGRFDRTWLILQCS